AARPGLPHDPVDELRAVRDLGVGPERGLHAGRGARAAHVGVDPGVACREEAPRERRRPIQERAPEGPELRCAPVAGLAQNRGPLLRRDAVRRLRQVDVDRELDAISHRHVERLPRPVRLGRAGRIERVAPPRGVARSRRARGRRRDERELDEYETPGDQGEQRCRTSAGRRPGGPPAGRDRQLAGKQAACGRRARVVTHCGEERAPFAVSSDETQDAFASQSPRFDPTAVTVVGPYKGLRYFAAGGMAWLYEARHPPFPEKRLAVKLMKSEFAMMPQMRDRFLREAQLLARVGHPHLVSVHSFGVDETSRCPYFAMDYIDGGTLAERLDA